MFSSDRKSTRLNSSHAKTSNKKKNKQSQGIKEIEDYFKAAMEELERFDKRLANMATKLNNLACNISKAAKPRPRLSRSVTDLKQAPERKRLAETATEEDENNDNSNNNKTHQLPGFDHNDNESSTTTPPPDRKSVV